MARQRFRAFCEHLHAVALGIWLGALGITGAAAAIAFPTMRRLDPTLPGFEAVSDHWRIAAGSIMQRVFLLADRVQIACAVVGAAGLAAAMLTARVGPARSPTALRLGGLAIAVGCLGLSVLWLSPRMNSNLDDFWSEARAGRPETALAARARFDRDHPTASALLMGTAAGLVLSIAGGAWHSLREGSRP